MVCLFCTSIPWHRPTPPSQLDFPRAPEDQTKSTKDLEKVHHIHPLGAVQTSQEQTRLVNHVLKEKAPASLSISYLCFNAFFA